MSTDEEKHQLINEIYSVTHQFSAKDIFSLQNKLGFKSLPDFQHWLRTEQKKLIKEHSFHNFIRVDSPYDGTFANLIWGVWLITLCNP